MLTCEEAPTEARDQCGKYTRTRVCPVGGFPSSQTTCHSKNGDIYLFQDAVSGLSAQCARVLTAEHSTSSKGCSDSSARYSVHIPPRSGRNAYLLELIEPSRVVGTMWLIPSIEALLKPSAVDTNGVLNTERIVSNELVVTLFAGQYPLKQILHSQTNRGRLWRVRGSKRYIHIVSLWATHFSCFLTFLSLFLYAFL